MLRSSNLGTPRFLLRFSRGVLCAWMSDMTTCLACVWHKEGRIGMDALLLLSRPCTMDVMDYAGVPCLAWVLPLSAGVLCGRAGPQVGHHRPLVHLREQHGFHPGLCASTDGNAAPGSCRTIACTWRYWLQPTWWLCPGEAYRQVVPHEGRAHEI